MKLLPPNLNSRLLLALALVLVIGLYGVSPSVFAHAEHDRARFVSATGSDAGRCDSPVRACRSIAFAVKQANKGDKVLVASGRYAIDNGEDLFFLTSALVPVLGGYNKFDHFQSQAPQLNATILTGVPQPFVEQLQQQGFVVVNDGFASVPRDYQQLAATQAQLQQSQPAAACVNGKAGIYSCKNIDLVSHLALGDFSSSPTAASDIWGHVDLNTGTEYAIIGLYNGTAVVSLADPAAPKEIGTIPGSSTSWRDIKVLQYYDAALSRWKAYAYISSEGTDNLQIVDLSQLPTSIRLVSADTAVTSAHNVYISHVDYTTNTALDGLEPTLHIVGQKAVGGSFTTYGLKTPEQLASYFPNSQAVRSDYTHDAASMVVRDARANQSCQNSRCTVLMDFNEQSVRLWDISQLSGAKALSDITYQNASYVHSGWWSEDQRFVFVHDELDERNAGLNTTVRVLNVDDLRNPLLAKVWSGPTAAIDHNGYTRGNRYYISNYQRGTTILDITDPTNPTEAGFFDSFPSSDSAAFNGVWGTYPYLPSGLIISADINSGLYVLRDQTKTSTAGQVSFKSASSQFAAGVPVQVTVQRPAGSGAVKVRYETLNGFGLVSDGPYASGELNWGASDLADKVIQITAPTADVAPKMLFVRLFDPRNGLTLGSPSYHTVRIGSAGSASGAVGFVAPLLSVDENQPTANVAVGRFGGNAGSMQISYQLVDGSAKAGVDFVAQSGELQWADGDAADKTVVVTLTDDQLLEGNEEFLVRLQVISGSLAPDKSQLTVQIKDNEVNKLPVIGTLIFPAEVNGGATTTIETTATDADGDTLSYQWQQTTGTAVTLQNATTNKLSFVAPAQSSTLGFQLTVTDSRGGISTANASLQVKAAVTTTPVTPSSGGSGGSLGWWSLSLLIFVLWRRRG
ncbi:choice-of-anchor B family protein [Rheinheimera riviphila]|uniref:Choice-of-anchor B family protein n=1 Tax=Rheinheimera riviphila TaxID=1834037 RepID=A0A437QFR1_9GAMM|nr:choice-of-anchor B family protein [Rheinheimera riviphila]RVU33352.1 choice-of-anchor B family protein [Rheinheimera riviphila]